MIKECSDKEGEPMFKKMKTEYISWIFLIGMVLLIVELASPDGGLIYSLAFSIGCIFTGKKYHRKVFGKILFIIGIFATLITIMDTMVFKFFLMAILIYFLLLFYQSKKNPHWIKPILMEPTESNKECIRERLVKMGSLFQNKWFGQQKTPDAVYEWNDINIQNGIGNIVIDLSQTILPKGNAVISIRSLVGNMEILVPYGVDVYIHHSVIAGRTRIFENRMEEKIFNQIISYKTLDFDEAKQKIHITTAVIVGDLEVRRV